MTKVERRLSLDRPAPYRIRVPGHLDAYWAEWAGEMTIVIDSDGHGRPVTTLSGAMDQAALQGLLRRLYSLGLPLISVNLDEDDQFKVEPSFIAPNSS